MRKRRLAVLLLLGLVMSLAVNAARGEDAPAEPVQPLTLDDVRDLRQDKKSNAEIIEAAKERGLAFEVDNKMLLHLKRMRFSDEDIESLKTIAAAPAKAAGDQAADQAGDKKERAVNPNARCGPRMPEAVQVKHAEMMKQMLAASQVGAQQFEAGSFTLVASEPVAREHIGDAMRIQQILAKMYGGVFEQGLDRRSAYIVLLDDDYQFKAFIDAMFAVYEKNGIRFNAPNAREMALQASSFSIDTMAIINLSKIQRGKPSRTAVVYQIGRMMMLQLTDGRATDAMVCGFGNVAEVIMYNLPSFTSISYEPRAINATDAWANVVRQKIRDNQLARPHDVLQTYSTANMQFSQYCEAWSLMAVLSAEREQFEKLVTAVRDAPQNTPIINSIETVYEIDEPTLMDGWMRSAR